MPYIKLENSDGLEKTQTTKQKIFFGALLGRRNTSITILLATWLCVKLFINCIILIKSKLINKPLFSNKLNVLHQYWYNNINILTL